MVKLSGREREIKSIQDLYKAAAVGRLMLRELSSWDEFKIEGVESLSRREIKQLFKETKKVLPKEIDKLCSKNFIDMDIRILVGLYNEIIINKVYCG